MRRNYGENADTPGALLDGIQFAGAAHRIQGDFTHDHYPYGLFHAERTLTEMLSGSTWEEDDDDDDDEYLVDDETGEEAA